MEYKVVEYNKRIALVQNPTGAELVGIFVVSADFFTASSREQRESREMHSR